MPTRAAVLVVAIALAACEHRTTPGEPSRLARATRPGTPISMVELHRAGGVPPTWRFTVPPGDVDAGRRAFADLGCPSCHEVSGEEFGGQAKGGVGPDLTGMGGHHPAEYFAESILNPDAVLVSGPGYLDADGRSVMPTYPDITMAQLADLVAYLKSLRTGGASELVQMAAAAPRRAATDVPPPPAQAATIFYVQVYDVQAGQLEDFEAWFRTEGVSGFLAHDGVVGVDTWVDLTRDAPALSTVIGFRDEAALKRFVDDPAGAALGAKFDEFIGPHQHRVFRALPTYRADTLSAAPR